MLIDILLTNAGVGSTFKLLLFAYLFDFTTLAFYHLDYDFFLFIRLVTVILIVIIIFCHCRSATAGLLISYTVGLRHNFCCRGPILIPSPDSETSAQTTRTFVLDFFVKPKNGISAFYTKKTLDKNTNKNTQKIRF